VSDGDARTRVFAFLRQHDLLAPGEHAVITPIAGGVSSDLWKVELSSGVICVKGALPQLKVAQPWFAPVSRNHVEYEWLRFAQGVRPEQVPRLLEHDETAGLFAMEYLPPGRYPVWKALLLAGRVDVGAARAVGELVGHLHAASAADPDSAVRFATDTNFEALRIDPYLRVTARAHPELADRLSVLADRTASTHLAVAHGDVSPKNILLGPAGPVLLDAECAWFGDPAFDVAFCVNHLLIKSVKMPRHGEALVAAAHALAGAHAERVNWEPTSALTARVVALLPALALARVDGSSPVEYLGDGEREIVRRVAVDLLTTPAGTLDELCERWIRARAAARPSVATPG
jgi:tRNA A-37 threonylcarbamoyl transferase component Bud32